MKHYITLLVVLFVALIGTFSTSAKEDIFGPVLPNNTAKIIVDRAVKEAKTYTDTAVAGAADAADVVSLSNKIEEVDAKFSNYLTTAGAYEAYQPKGSYVTTADAQANYQPKGEYLTAHQDISGKLDKSEVFNASGLFETSYTGSDGTVAKIFNEADGGGVQIIDGTSGVQAAMAVHAGGADIGLYGQWYAIKKIDGKSVGTRITVTDTGAYYTVTNTYQWTADDEIATRRQINELRAALEAALERIQALENK